MKIKLLSFLILSFAVANSAQAAVTVVKTGGVSTLSFKPATIITGSGAGIATAGIINNNWLGTLVGGAIAAGGVAVAIIDPPGGTFYSGAFDIYYPSDLMTPDISGWLGAWGEDPTLSPPPVNIEDWGTPGNETIFTLQSPNAALNASVANTVPGVQNITFDWGTGGHTESSSDPINIFAAKFIANRDLQATYLGDFTSPPVAANFYLSAPEGITCLPPGETILQQCGDSTTSYFSIKVPEPSSLMLLLIGAGAILSRFNGRKAK